MHRNPARGMAVGTLVCVWMMTLTALPAGAAPSTTPTITTPTAAATVAGDVSISATSTAASVQFYVDAAPIGAPVAVVSGTATSDWLSWGTANGSHALTAADCDGSGCNASVSPAIAVTLNNTAPTVTAPVNGATTSTSLTLAATAPGGGLMFFVDTVQVGFDPTSPYSFPVAGPLSEGAHSMSVAECDTGGTLCNGPTAGASFTVKLLHPQITSVVPNPFSPNGDGRNDRLAFKVHLPDTENVSLSVQNGNGQLVWGPHAPGPTGAGDRVFHWDGRNNASKIAGDGVYTIVVATTAVQSGAALHGTAHSTARLDNTGPAFSGITGNRATFYPVRDGYQDGFRPRVHVGEGGGLWLRVVNGAGALVKLVAQPHSKAGYFYLTWNGTNRHNQLVPQGAYRFNFIAADAAGNRRNSAAGVVHVSHAHLVNKSVTLVQNGNAGVITTSDTNCTGYSYSLSAYTAGVWMDNVCDEYYDGFQYIGADYTFAVPGAARYNSIHVASVGNTINAPENIVSIIYNSAAGKWDPVGASRLGQNSVSLLSNFGTVAGAGHVSGGHRVKINIAVPDTEPPQDYDIARASITVNYSVLQ